MTTDRTPDPNHPDPDTLIEILERYRAHVAENRALLDRAKAVLTGCRVAYLPDPGGSAHVEYGTVVATQGGRIDSLLLQIRTGPAHGTATTEDLKTGPWIPLVNVLVTTATLGSDPGAEPETPDYRDAPIHPEQRPLHD